LAVPSGLPTDQAALTEPMAVGLHAVQKARLQRDDAPLVIGCGPVGLAVIVALRLLDVRPVVAADFSPRRRELAVALGADVVVGVCMEADAIHPMLGIVKELNLQFVLGYTQDEFAATLGHIAEGRIPTTPLITGRVGIDGVAQAFEALASPERHAKILVQTG